MQRTLLWVHLLFTFLIVSHTHAQEQLGLRLDSHAGILGSQLNPSSLAVSYLKWDINLVSAGIHFDNEYAFFRNTNLIDLAKGRNVVMANTEGVQSSNDLIIDFFDRDKKMNATVLGFAQGLSGFFTMGKHRVGLSFKARSYGRANQIPIVFGHAAYNRFPIDSTTSLNHTSITAMNWGEVALHYATTIKDNRNATIAVGGNLKYLMGYDAVYMNVSKNTQFTKLTEQVVSATDGIIQVGAATNIVDMSNNGDTPANSYAPKVLGTGVGLDLGVTFVQKSNDKEYDLKFGISILDLGAINYGKEARAVSINLNDFIQFAQDSFRQFLNTDATLDQLIEDANEQANGVTTREKFAMGLPTALSVQMDKPLSKTFYINGTWVQRFAPGDRHSKRRNLLAVSPRLDFKWWGIQMPVSWVDYQQLQWGLSARVGPLTIGSERLNTVFIKQNQFAGSDLYVSLKIDTFTFKKKGNDAKVKCWQENY